MFSEALWTSLACALAWAPSSPDTGLSQERVRISVETPGTIARWSDAFWEKTATELIGQVSQKRSTSRELILAEARKAGVALELPDPDTQDVATTGTYGILPEIMVDRGHGAILPRPLKTPARYSWYRLSRQAALTLQYFRQAEQSAQDPKRLPHAGLLWRQATHESTVLAQHLRYLSLWVPQLTSAGELAASHHPKLIAWNRILSQKDTSEEARSKLRPQRIMKRSFLPAVWKGTVPLPIATDITDRRFLKEFEGALETHWNQSPWALQQGVRFKVVWKQVPENQAFKDGRVDLIAHLKQFPRETFILTTGALAPTVRDRAFILGPGRIDPRTIAHEIGHLLGFDDCYARALDSEGLLGVAVTEWDNPLHPDELMCDNTIGVVQRTSPPLISN